MAKKTEPTLTHNGITYRIAELSDAAKQQIVNMQTTDNEIKRLQVQLTIAQTAKNAYQQALIAQLPEQNG
jgi:hypothetical protein